MSGRRAMRGGRVFAVVGFAILSSIGGVSAQPTASERVRDRLMVVVGARFDSWTADVDGPDGEPLKQAGGYASASVPLSARVRFGFSTGGASTSWGPGAKLEGLHDTQALLSYQARNDVLLRIGANIPTGKRALTAEESRIARGMADRTRALPVSEPGEGFDLQVGAAWSFRWHEASGAFAANFLRKGSYEALDSHADYQPGNQFSGAFSFESGSRALYWKGVAVLSIYGKDTIEGRDVFQFGNRWRFEALAGGARRIQWQLRTRAVLQDANALAVDGKLDPGRTDEPGAGWYFDGTAGLPVRPGLRILALAGARFVDGGSDGAAGGRRFDVGTGVEAGISRTTSLTARGRYSSGRLDTPQEQDDVNLSGFGLDVSLAYHR